MWLTIIGIIFSIIEAIPTIEALIKEIIAALEGQPLQAAMDFEKLLMANRDVSDPVATEAAIRAFHARVTATKP